MSDVIGPQKGFPSRVNRLLVWIGIPTVLLLAIAGLFGAFDKASEAGAKMCQAIHLCAGQKEIPKLPNYTSTRVDGGHSFPEMCGPVKKKYENEYPDYSVEQIDIDDGRNKDGLGHATYAYTCGFTLKPK